MATNRFCVDQDRSFCFFMDVVDLTTRLSCLQSHLTSSPSPSHQYEPRGPGRPLYQRRISSSYPDETAGAQAPPPCPADLQEHPHPHQHPHQHGHPHAPYGYPPPELWPGNGGGPPGPFHNIPCNGASTLQHRDLIGRGPESYLLLFIVALCSTVPVMPLTVMQLLILTNAWVLSNTATDFQLYRVPGSQEQSYTQ